jgi:TP901 family phage tail tape measure protein
MANKDFRLTAILAVRDTMSPVLAVASQKWEGFKTAVNSTEFDDLNRKLKLAQRSVKDFASEAQGVAQSVGAPFAAVAGAVGFSLQSAVTGFAQAGDSLDKMSARLGISAVKLQEWSFAATHAGAAPEDLEDALKDMSEKIAEVAGGDTGDAAQLFSALGISVKDASGKIRPASDIFEEVADAIQRNEDPALRTKMAMVLMGDSGRKLIPMLSGGAQGLDDMAKQARDLGLVMNEDAVAAAAQLTDRMDDMKASVTAVGHEIGYRLSPIVISMSDRFRDLAAANKGALGEKFERVARSFADSISKIDFEGIASAILTIADYGVRAFNAIGGFNTVLYGMGALIAGKSVMAVVSLGSSLIGLVQSFGAVATAAKAFAAVASTSLGPIGLILGALSLAAGFVIANWDEIGPAVKETIGSVVDFAVGAFETCYEKFSAVGKAIVTVATGFFKGDFKTLFSGFDDLIVASFNLLPDSWAKAATNWYESVKSSVLKIGEYIKGFFTSFDFSNLIPDWAKKMLGIGGSTAHAQDKNEDRPEETVRTRIGFGEDQRAELAPAAFQPESRVRMSGQMLVRVAASPGTTAQLADMSSDGMKLTGSVGYADRYAMEDSF